MQKKKDSLRYKSWLLLFLCFLITSFQKAEAKDKIQINTQKVVFKTPKEKKETMKYFCLKRKEREPIRQSYERTSVFIIKDSVLYYKRFSWGRISVNRTECIRLSLEQLQLLQQALNHPKLKTNLEEFTPEDESNEQLTYHINITTTSSQFHQKLSAPGNHIYKNHRHIDELWRLVAHFVPRKKIIEPYSPTSKSLKLNLSIKETIRSKDTEIKIRSYHLNGNNLDIVLQRKGRFREEKKTQYTLSDEWLAQINQFIEHEKNHLIDASWEENPPSHNPWPYFPIVEAQFSAELAETKYSSNITGSQFLLLESIHYIVLESLEKLLDPENEFNNSFEKEIYNKRFQQALDKYNNQK